MYQYSIHNKKLIEPYQLGMISTKEFLQNLIKIFPFLRHADAQEEFIPKLNVSESYSDEFALALLENAWNEIIDLDKTRFSRFPLLVEMSEGEPVYLISNTNELNVLKILRLLKEQNPGFPFEASIDLSVQENKAPIEIMPNIFLCLSYRYQLFKTANANPYSTMSLLNHLVTSQLPDEQPSDIYVVSQFSGDLAEAAQLGIPTGNIFNADHFFNDTMLEMKKIN